MRICNLANEMSHTKCISYSIRNEVVGRTWLCSHGLQSKDTLGRTQVLSLVAMQRKAFQFDDNSIHIQSDLRIARAVCRPRSVVKIGHFYWYNRHIYNWIATEIWPWEKGYPGFYSQAGMWKSTLIFFQFTDTVRSYRGSIGASGPRWSLQAHDLLANL